LIKYPLIYSVPHFCLEGLRTPMLPRGNGTGLNYPYAVIIEIRRLSRNQNCNRRIK